MKLMYNHTFVKTPPKYWVAKEAGNHMVQCSKCKMYAFTSRHVSIKFLNLYIKETRSRRAKVIKKYKKQSMSFGRNKNISFGHSYYVKDGMIHTINYKQQLIIKAKCPISDEDFLVKEIIQ